jgi:hypothetical protein
MTKPQVPGVEVMTKTLHTAVLIAKLRKRNQVLKAQIDLMVLTSPPMWVDDNFVPLDNTGLEDLRTLLINPYLGPNAKRRIEDRILTVENQEVKS